MERITDAVDPDPWMGKTGARVHDHLNRPWLVEVGWAEAPGGAIVPAVVTLSSTFAAHGETALLAPVSVTRSVIDSIQWAEVIWSSREHLHAHAADNHEPDCAAHDGFNPGAERRPLLQRVAGLYRGFGGEGAKQIAQRVREQLEAEGVTPRGGGTLSDTTVRRWIKEARDAGLIPPVTRQPSPKRSKPAQRATKPTNEKD